jgi:hypothetical protein
MIDQGKRRHSHDDFGPVTQPIFDYLADLPDARSGTGLPVPLFIILAAPQHRGKRTGQGGSTTE